MLKSTSSGSARAPQLVEVAEKGLGIPKVKHPKEPLEGASNGRQAESLAEMLRTSTPSWPPSGCSEGPTTGTGTSSWLTTLQRWVYLEMS